MAQKPLADRIANKLARGVPVRDLVPEVCDATGMGWDDAEKYVHDIGRFKQTHISNQRFPILAAISVGTSLLGLAILAYTIIPLQSDLSAALATLNDDSAVDAALNFLSHSPVFGEILIGICMVMGGMIGLGRALYDRLQGE